ncbi:hypothetical protein LV779_08060 [Streptomyces thinghirensis]|nr:hypothetical protein [Streptomyces thinghirensis]
MMRSTSPHSARGAGRPAASRARAAAPRRRAACGRSAREGVGLGETLAGEGEGGAAGAGDGETLAVQCEGAAIAAAFLHPPPDHRVEPHRRQSRRPRRPGRRPCGDRHRGGHRRPSGDRPAPRPRRGMADLGPAAPVLHGRTLVNPANSTPDQARELAAWASGTASTTSTAPCWFSRHRRHTGRLLPLQRSRHAFTTHRRELEVRWLRPTAPGTDPRRRGGPRPCPAGHRIRGPHRVPALRALLASVGTTPETFAPLAARWLHGMAEFLPELHVRPERRRIRTGSPRSI